MRHIGFVTLCKQSGNISTKMHSFCEKYTKDPIGLVSHVPYDPLIRLACIARPEGVPA